MVSSEASSEEYFDRADAINVDPRAPTADHADR
jgi:hypothetical protein